RVVARAIYLANNPRPPVIAGAPLSCMALFPATRKAKIIAWSPTAMVICFIVLLRRVRRPWRGTVDLGVVVALIWGALAIAYFFVAALAGHHPPSAAALPEPKS